MAEERTLQDVMSGDLFASGSASEMSQVLKFFYEHGTPLTPRQVAGMAYLNYLDTRGGKKEYEAIGKALTKHSKDLTSPNLYLEVVDKMTLGDKIKGNVRLSKMFGSDK